MQGVIKTITGWSAATGCIIDLGDNVARIIPLGVNVTLDGEKAECSDLRAGDVVILKGNPVTDIRATRPE